MIVNATKDTRKERMERALVYSRRFLLRCQPRDETRLKPSVYLATRLQNIGNNFYRDLEYQGCQTRQAW